MTNIQIWEEMNRAAVQSLFVELTPEGTRFNFFTRNKPELLPVLEAAEDRYATGQVSRRQLGTFVSRVLRENNMLPNNTRHREVIEAFMEREIYGP